MVLPYFPKFWVKVMFDEYRDWCMGTIMKWAMSIALITCWYKDFNMRRKGQCSSQKCWVHVWWFYIFIMKLCKYYTLLLCLIEHLIVSHSCIDCRNIVLKTKPKIKIHVFLQTSRHVDWPPDLESKCCLTCLKTLVRTLKYMNNTKQSLFSDTHLGKIHSIGRFPHLSQTKSFLHLSCFYNTNHGLSLTSCTCI